MTEFPRLGIIGLVRGPRFSVKSELQNRRIAGFKAIVEFYRRKIKNWVEGEVSGIVE